MVYLQNTTVLRSGVTKVRWGHGTRQVQVGVEENCLALNFKIDSKGGGQTEVELRIGKEDFPALLENMFDAGARSALEAMANEVARKIGLS